MTLTVLLGFLWWRHLHRARLQQSGGACSSVQGGQLSPWAHRVSPEAAKMGQVRALQGLVCQRPAGQARGAEERGASRHSGLPEIPAGLRTGAWSAAV